MTQQHSGSDAGAASDAASLNARIEQRAAEMWQQRLPHVEKAWEDNQPAFESAWQRNQEQIKAEWEAGGTTPANPEASLADAKQQYFDRQQHEHFTSTHARCFQDAAELEVHGRILTSGVMAPAAEIRRPESTAAVNDPPHHPSVPTGTWRTPDVGK